MSLAGKRVVVTRAAEQTEELSELLRKEGAEPLAVSTIAFVPPRNAGLAARAVRDLPKYSLLVFTSANAVRFFLERARFAPEDSRFIGLKVAAIGPKTASALSDAGMNVDIVPAEAKASEELLEAILEKLKVPNLKVLIPRAEEGREVLADSLRAAGADVEVVPFYRTVPCEEGREKVSRFLSGEHVDWITFASGSAVRSFFDLCGSDLTREWIERERVLLASIGKVTEGALLEYGLSAGVIAPEPTLEAMVAAMARFEERKNHE
ncbi:MAG: uroporphyrinogen-III synthase [Pseudomonadota bacterium]